MCGDAWLRLDHERHETPRKGHEKENALRSKVFVIFSRRFVIFVVQT